MSAINTCGRLVSETPLDVKIGEQFSVVLEFPTSVTGWAGMTGYAAITASTGAVLHTFDTPTLAIAGDTTAALAFVATVAQTATWPVGVYWVDFAWDLGGAVAKTKTYKLNVTRGPSTP